MSQYTIKDEDGNDVTSGQLAGTTTMAVLKPGVGYAIDVTASVLDDATPPSVVPTWDTLFFDLETNCNEAVTYPPRVANAACLGLGLGLGLTKKTR